MADPTPATALAVRERGYTVPYPSGFWVVPDLNEQTPELLWPQCLDIYDAMSRQDAQVSSVFSAVTSPILGTQWRVDGTGCDPNVTAHVARDLGLPVVGEGNEVPAVRIRDRFSWSEHLELALLMLRYGHSYFEQVYRIDEGDGLAHLRKLGWRPPRTIARFNVARDGGLVSIEQYQSFGQSGTITLPVSRLVGYVHGQEGGNWIGHSLLRTAYKHWLLKDRLLRVQTQTIERNGMGIPIYKATEDGDDFNAGKKMATEIRAGDAAGGAIPNGAELELKGVTGTLPNAQSAIDYHDQQIGRSVLAHFLNLGTQTGSWALGSTFADFFSMSLQTVGQDVRDIGQQHIVEDLVDINFGPDEPAPQLTFQEIGSRHAVTAEAIALLVNSGVLLKEPALERYIRETYGIPEKEPLPGQEPPPAPTTTTPAPSGTGEGADS